MRIQSFHDEAEACRRTAVLFAGKPEAAFLLQIASSFEELAVTSRGMGPSPSKRGLEESSRVGGEPVGGA